METEVIPEELQDATARLVTETVARLHEVLRYGDAPADHEWPRMLLYRLTDAQDTLGMLVGLHAAHALRSGCTPEALRRYMQTSHQRARVEMPQRQDLDYLDGVLGRPAENPESVLYRTATIRREHCGESDHHQEWTLACIHALQALVYDAPGELEELPPKIRIKAARVYATLTGEGCEPEPAGT